MKDFKLDQIPKINSGFKVPDNYFDDFDKKIISQVSTKEVKVVSIFSKSKFWMSAAAIIIIGISTSLYIFKNQEQAISNEEYLTLDESLNTEDLAMFLSENDIKSIENSLIIYDLETIKLAEENL